MLFNLSKKGDDKMKKIIILAIVAFSCCFAAFAGNITMGVEQGLMTTTYRFGYDFGRWCEVGGGVGIPVVFGVANTIDNLTSEPEIDSETGEEIPKEPWYKAAHEMCTLPRAELYAHFKAVDTNHFDLRLGAYAWAQACISSTTTATAIAFAGPCLEISYKFNDNFRMYLNGNYPVFATGGQIGDASGWELVGMILMGVYDIAHVGLSWTL